MTEVIENNHFYSEIYSELEGITQGVQQEAFDGFDFSVYKVGFQHVEGYITKEDSQTRHNPMREFKEELTKVVTKRLERLETLYVKAFITYKFEYLNLDHAQDKNNLLDEFKDLYDVFKQKRSYLKNIDNKLQQEY